MFPDPWPLSAYDIADSMGSATAEVPVLPVQKRHSVAFLRLEAEGESMHYHLNG